MLRIVYNHLGLLTKQSHVFNKLQKVSNFEQVLKVGSGSRNPCLRNFCIEMQSAGKTSTTLCLKDYDVIGFDIDHTLAKYNIPYLFNQVHDNFAKALVKKGYDASILEPFEIHRDLCARGLVVDINRGNLLKVGKNGVILRANHGTKSMTEEEIISTYGKQKLFEHYEDFLNKGDNIKKDGVLSHLMVDNFYDVIFVVVLARMVDLVDKKAEKKPEVYDILLDAQTALTSVYHYTNFKAEKGGFFPMFAKNTGDFVEKLSTEVKDWLKKLKAEGKVLFLMTSSYVDFASCTMNYILGEDWQQYFDTILTYSRKPSFFFANNHFLRLDGTTEKEPVTDLKQGEIYSQGNVKLFTELLAKLSGKNDPKVLYFGDGLRSDIVSAKKHAHWDTVLIYEEIEAELGDVVRSKAKTQDEDSDEPAKKKLKGDPGSSNGTAKLKKPDDKEREYLSSPRWGSFLVDDVGNKDGNLEVTMYGEVMRKYTDLAIAQIPYMADLPLDHHFTRINPGELSVDGFYPRPPEILRHLPTTDGSKKPPT